MDKLGTLDDYVSSRKRVKLEGGKENAPSGALAADAAGRTPAAKRRKNETFVTPEELAASPEELAASPELKAAAEPRESQPLEPSLVVAPEAARAAAFAAAEAAGEVIDADAWVGAPAADVFSPEAASDEVLVKVEALCRAEEAATDRAAAERLYEARVWPDAKRAPALEGAWTVIRASGVVADAAGFEVGCPVPLAALAIACPELAALVAAARDAHALDVRATARALEPLGGEVRVDLDVAVRVRAAALGDRGGHYGDGVAGLAGAVGAVLAARGDAVAMDLKTRGLCLPPRAQRAGHEALRTCDGLLDALETEGTRGPAVEAAVRGLAVTLTDYQIETVTWLVARETGASSIEDLFCSRVSEHVAAVSLPAPRFRRDWPRKGPCPEEMAAQRALADVKTAFVRDSAVLGATHRGGILAEEMGLGKSVEVMALALLHPAPEAWASRDALKATLVISPPALLGQWRAELASRCPDATVVEWDAAEGLRAKRLRSADFVLCAYGDAASCAGSGAAFWRCVLDEPHAALTARARTCRVDVSPAVEACAHVRAPNRWCVTGTPFGNGLFDVFGQLTFLGLVPRVLPVNYFRCILSNNFPSAYNSTAEIVCSMLKPLVVRHSKSSERDGARLVSLPALRPREDVVVRAPLGAYAALAAEQRRRRDAGEDPSRRLAAAAHALEPLAALCGGVDGAARSRHDSVAGCSNVESIRVAFPDREDADADAACVASQDLQTFRRALDEGLAQRGGERRCVCCLKPCAGLAPRAARTCGHLLCGQCVEDLFAGAKSTSDTPEGVAHEVPEDERLADDVVRERPYLYVRGALPSDLHGDRGRHRATERLKSLFRPYAARSTMDVRFHVSLEREPYATCRLVTKEAEDAAAAALDGSRAADVFPGGGFGDDAAIRVLRSKHTVASVPCPACGVRFAAEDVLDLGPDVLEVPNRGRWHPSVRNFVLDHRRRARDRDRAPPAPEPPADASLADAKVAEVVELLAGRDAPALVFCASYDGVARVARGLEAAGVAVASFTGATPRSKRERAVAALQAGRVAALVATLGAGGVGLNLTAAALVVFFEPCLDASAYRQAVGRAHRLGQTREVRVAVLAVEGTHEETALALLDARLPPRDLGNGLEQDQAKLKLHALADATLSQF
jgi:hypothetical protein